jgi:hypothetical protein
MNYFFEAFNHSSIFCVVADGLKFFVASFMSRKVLIKFLFSSMKTFNNYGYPEAASVSPPPPHHPPTRLAATQRDCEPQFSL